MVAPNIDIFVCKRFKSLYPFIIWCCCF